MQPVIFDFIGRCKCCMWSCSSS